MNTAQLVPQDVFTSTAQRLASAAYLSRFKGQSRVHTESDLRAFFSWCWRDDLEPAFYRVPPAIGRFWVLPDMRHRRGAALSSGLRPSSPGLRRLPDAGSHAPAVRGHAERWQGLGKHQRLRSLSDAGLLGLGIFEATGVDLESLDEVHGDRVLRVLGKGDKPALVPLPRRSGGPLTAQSTAGQAGRSFAAVPAAGWIGTTRRAVSVPWRKRQGYAPRVCTLTCCGTPTSHDARRRG
jgi:integrase/recombinase XerD